MPSNKLETLEETNLTFLVSLCKYAKPYWIGSFTKFTPKKKKSILNVLDISNCFFTGAHHMFTLKFQDKPLNIRGNLKMAQCPVMTACNT